MDPNTPAEGAMARYLEGPALLARAVAGLPDADLDASPAQGGWTIRQIVHHVVDGDALWKSGILAALGETTGEFSFKWYWAMSQEEWVECWAYARRSLDASLNLLAANRIHVAQLLEAVPDGWDRSVGVHKPDGELWRLTVHALIEMQTDHLEHHLRRIASIRREGGLD